jgi:hypothetical protein
MRVLHCSLIIMIAPQLTDYHNSLLVSIAHNLCIEEDMNNMMRRAQCLVMMFCVATLLSLLGAQSFASEHNLTVVIL